MSHQTQALELGPYTVTIALGAPRILGFKRRSGPELFASLPGAVIESAAGRLSLLGGHRLWRAPEIPAVTYQPDDHPIMADQFDDGVRLTGAADSHGVAKTIELRQRGEHVVVDHALVNQGERTVRTAAWAITQFTPGGVAVLPQSHDPIDTAGVLPNRIVALWPYTDLQAPEFEFRTEEIRIQASLSQRRAKLAIDNRRGWLAYALGAEVFVKWAPLNDDTMDYVDFGASMQCYRDHRFLELETLGPLTDLAPGGVVQHREVWRLFDLQERTLEELLTSLPEQPPKGPD